MKIHILGICGTFMASIANLAKQLGHEVRGCDANVYPPMSTQLQQLAIDVIEGYAVSQLQYQPDLIIIGNTMKRGMPIVEYILNQALPYQSAPQWLSESILANRWVLAVSGTHGKTTTTSMLAWILDYAGLAPSFLIGGVAENFAASARLTDSDYFVIEADEYDTAFFDKRSKFIHYHPRSLIINNLEYDHSDIFPDLAAIQTQFHHLVRTVPSAGVIVTPVNAPNIDAVLAQECWTPILQIGKDWCYELLTPDAASFCLQHGEQSVNIDWGLIGEFNVQNATAAAAAAHQLGISLTDIGQALSSFRNSKRRLEVKGQVNQITVYDDFAHHPTAIAATLRALRLHVGAARIIAIVELGSYTMRNGTHAERLSCALHEANSVYCYAAGEIKDSNLSIYTNVDDILQAVTPTLQAGDHVVIMSNRSFAGIHRKLLQALERNNEQVN